MHETWRTNFTLQVHYEHQTKNKKKCGFREKGVEVLVGYRQA